MAGAFTIVLCRLRRSHTAHAFSTSKPGSVLRAMGALEKDVMRWIAFALGLGAPLRASRIGVLVSVLLWPWLPIARLIAAGMLGQLD